MALAMHRTPSLSFSELTDDSASFPVTPSQSQLLDIPKPNKGKAPMYRPPPSAFHVTRVPSNILLRPHSFHPSSNIAFSLPNALQLPGVLSRLLSFLHWSDFRSIAFACKQCFNSLQRTELRDAVLSRFVPGYRYCLAQSDPASFRDVPLRFQDLDLFMASQRISLHKYPMHALSILAALLPTERHIARSQHFADVCLAHSRIVLLLQSLAHSSQLPVAEDADDIRFRLRSTAAAQSAGSSAVRELVFPAPLSYFGQTAQEPQPEALISRAASRKKAQKIVSRRSIAHSRSPSAPNSPTPALQSTDPFVRATSGPPPAHSTSFFSTLGSRRVPLPRPTDDPLSLKTYASSWRRRRQSISVSASDSEDVLFRRPQRHFATVTPPSRSSRSSFDHSPSPASREPPPAPSTALSGPHDIRLATSRLRAPVLRVFHPCTELDEPAIDACEDMLDDAGLWTHLSTGDVICNLGYIPPEDTSAGSTSSSDVSSAEAHAIWLMFDGSRLVPYSPGDPLPLADPLSLPSPLYYLHVTPQNVNPRLRLALPYQPDPQLTLTVLPATIPSPHSPRGVARTKRYVWIAQARARQRDDLGAGWQGEWTLEGEGTKEGRQRLIDALGGGVEHEYEMAADKTTGTRLWLRLVS